MTKKQKIFTASAFMILAVGDRGTGVMSSRTVTRPPSLCHRDLLIFCFFQEEAIYYNKHENTVNSADKEIH
jgi:hypothetical protein